MHEPPAEPLFSDEEFPLQAVTGTTIAAAYAVFRSFGFGFLESVYRRALVVELKRRGVRVDQEVACELFHHGESVGLYKADMVVDSRVIVEIKTGPVSDVYAPTQVLNYLCAAGLSVGLIIHFGPTGAKARGVVSTNPFRSVAPRS